MQKGFYPVGEVFFALCKTVDTPISLGAWLRFKHLCHDDLATMDIRPRDYTSASRFQDDYLIVSFLRKWVGLKTSFDLEAEALRSFTLSEARCRETNIRLRNFATVPNGTLHEVFHLAQRKIAKLLGPFSLFAISDSYGWGPGATVEIPKRRAFLDTKMCELPITVTRSARALLRDTIEGDRHWLSSFLGPVDGPVCLLPEVFKIVDGCKVTTVPKSAKTDRTIAIEPRGNSFLQKGFGGYFRDRLRKAGQDLSDQSRNQELACCAISQHLATLDLKAASDTVSTELVYQLLPVEWANALDSLRSRRAEMPDGSWVVLEKFSSMGNGFTFELESLIFWALAQSVSDLGSRGVVSVYGDDLIVNRDDVSTLVEVLTFSGFELNKEKSFVEGEFFESCGKHFFQGKDVTPVYQKEIVAKDDLSIVRLGNRLMRLAMNRGWSRTNRGVAPMRDPTDYAWVPLSAFDARPISELDDTLRSAWLTARRHAGRTQQFYMHLGEFGDDAWLLPLSIWPSIRQNQGQIRCRVASKRTRELPAHGAALYAWSLRRGPVRRKDKFFPSIEYSEGSYSLPGVRFDAVQTLTTVSATEWESFAAPKERLYDYRPVDRWVSAPTWVSFLDFGQ